MSILNSVITQFWETQGSLEIGIDYFQNCIKKWEENLRSLWTKCILVKVIKLIKLVSKNNKNTLQMNKSLIIEYRSSYF